VVDHAVVGVELDELVMAPVVDEVETAVDEIDDLAVVEQQSDRMFEVLDRHRLHCMDRLGAEAERSGGEQVAKGYVILTEAIHDTAGMDAYGRASRAALVEYGGTVLVVDEDVQVLEGEWHGTRTVIIEYESVEEARAWYESASYRAALPLRQAAADCNVVIASGFTLPRAEVG
jgi:uncharacterized protein (DUF1330 family)